IVQTVHRTGADSGSIAFDGNVEIPKGGWIAARVIGPASKYIGDDYAYAHTGPIYVVRGGKKYVRAGDVQFLSQTMDAICTQVDRARWRSPAERDRFKAELDSAKAVYTKLAAVAQP